MLFPLVFRKPATSKSESSLEPDTTESESSSKNETYSSVFLASTKNKQLFVKTLLRACVVCKNIENTVKCIGPCQSYFHKECLVKSEERYLKSEQKIVLKKKKSGRRKRHFSKCTNKNRDSIASVSQVINEESTGNLYETDDITLGSINGLNCLSIEQSSYDTDENKLLENPTSDKLSDFSKDKNFSESTENKDTQQLNEFECVNKDPTLEISEDKMINTPMKYSNNEKMSKYDSKYMCSLCQADKTNCFVCGLEIDDPGQKIMCKMCKLLL